MNRSQWAINSISTSGSDLEERLAAYSGAGFRKVEFFLGHVRDYLGAGRSVDDVKALLARYELQCIGGFETALMGYGTEEERVKNHARVIDNARLLGELGAATMVVGTDGPEAGFE